MKEMESLDLITAVVYFLNIGFFSAILSRFTGANMTMLILCSLLYIGGQPVETMGIMMTYLVFMRLTMYTQGNRLDFKHFQIFKGWRLAIPAVLILISLVVYPFAALAFFLAFFISELLYSMYHKMPVQDRVAPGTLAVSALIAAVIMTAGFAAVQFIPEAYYYGIAGFAILLLCAFFWWIGQDRSRLASSWDTVLYAAFLPAGLFGFDLTDWLNDMKRTGRASRLAANLPFITLPAFLITFIAANVFFGIFSFSGLILTFFSALGIRLFGYYEMSGKGKTNLVALAVTILAAVCLFLTAPQPTGIAHVIDVFLPSQPAVNLLDLL